MYRLYVEYALNILRHKPGYTLKRAVAFFGKYYRAFKEVFDIIAGIYDDQQQIKKAANLINIDMLTKRMASHMKFFDDMIQKAIKQENYQLTRSGGKLYKADGFIKGINTWWRVREYAHGSRFKMNLGRGIEIAEPKLPLDQMRAEGRKSWEAAKNWRKVILPGLELWNKSKPWGQVYKMTPEAVDTINEYVFKTEQTFALKQTMDNFWTGYVFLELLNL